MAPTFAIIGGILGLLNYVVIAAVGTAKSRIADRLDSIALLDPVNEAEWNNRKNWFGGLVYHSSRDTRTFVRKRLSGSGFTINVGRPIGLIITSALLALAFLIFILAL